MRENLQTRLENCNKVLLDIFRNTADEEIKAEINNIRTPIMVILYELNTCPVADSEQFAEEVLADAMARIKQIQDEIADAATMKSI